jgi:formyl-CoA transferase
VDENPVQPLRGVRVLELGNYIAAPTAGRLLADFGAEVVKIERPGTGDELRNWRLYAGTTSLLYRTINRGKKSVTLDLRTAAGRDVVLDLARHSDVLLENFRPGTLEKWGLGPDELDAVNPDLVVVRISAFGQTGPLAERPGFAAVAEAVGGLRELVGDPDRPPSRVGVSIGDSIAGLYAAFSALLGLVQRESRRTGPAPRLRERIFDVALNEAVLSMMESLVPDHLAYGVHRTRVGGRMEGIAPSNAYPCADGTSVIVAGNGDGIFRRLMSAIGRPDLGEDPALATNAGRWAQRDRLDAAIGAWTATQTRDEVLDALDVAAVPAGPVYTAADIVRDEQYRARRMIQYLPVDTGEGRREVGFPGIVPVVGDVSLPVRSLGPELGEHTAQVLGDVLGMDDEQIAALAAAGVERV